MRGEVSVFKVSSFSLVSVSYCSLGAHGTDGGGPQPRFPEGQRGTAPTKGDSTPLLQPSGWEQRGAHAGPALHQPREGMRHVGKPGQNQRSAITVFICPDDNRRALRARPHLRMSHDSDAILCPLLQGLQQDLTGGWGDIIHLLKLRVLRVQRSIVDAVAGQDAILAFGRRRPPTYQNGGGSGADALYVLRGGRRFYEGGKFRREREEGGKKQKMGKIKKKKKRK